MIDEHCWLPSRDLQVATRLITACCESCRTRKHRDSNTVDTSPFHDDDLRCMAARQLGPQRPLYQSEDAADDADRVTESADAEKGVNTHKTD